MRIATWNINGVRARLEFVQRWLAERRPDLVGIQELKASDEQIPLDELARSGYHAVVHGQKAWNGVAILARQAIEPTQIGLPGQDSAGARLIAANVGDLSFVTVYCPNGKSVDHPDFIAKLAWYDQLLAFIEERYTPDQKLVVCGDFNVVPAALDSWSEDFLEGSIFHTVAERERYQAFVDWGLHDVWRDRHPDDPGFTWWDYRGGAFGRDRGLRIDFLLATRPVVDAVRFVRVDREWRAKVDGLIASDHAPVYADLNDD